MRIFATSDLHYGVSSRGNDAIRSLANGIVSQATPDDVLALSGDLGNDDAAVAECLKLFVGFPGTRVAVAGNHDVWVAPGGDSWARFLHVQEIFRRHGFHPLDTEPCLVGHVGFVGSMGWYDYSFRDEIGIPIEAYRRKITPDGETIWGDALHVRWPGSDEEMTRYFLDQLAQQLRLLGRTDTVIGFLHHVPFKGLLTHPRWLIPKTWRFLNAFLGSQRFGDLLAMDTRVTNVICGHIHRAASVRHGNVLFTSIGSDDERKHLLVLERGRITRTSYRP